MECCVCGGDGEVEVPISFGQGATEGAIRYILEECTECWGSGEVEEE